MDEKTITEYGGMVIALIVISLVLTFTMELRGSVTEQFARQITSHFEETGSVVETTTN